MENNHNTRRSFLKRAALGGIVTASSPKVIMAAAPAKKKITINDNDVILFQGDSITDAGRKRETKDANNTSALGNGYAFMAAAALLKKHADKNLKIYNRGISGNKVYQLAERWQADALDLKPNILSILIGVNDFWHTLNGNYKGTIEKYRTDFRALLDSTRQSLPDVQLIIGEPFAVTGIKAVDEKWFPAFDEYRVAAREIAGSYHAVFIPYQSIFNQAQKKAPGVYWTGDGVHPSIAGCELMAESWLEAVK